MFPRALLLALALLVPAVAAASAPAAVTEVTFSDPAVVSGVRYSTATARWEGVATHDSPARPTSVTFWVSTADGTSHVFGRPDQPVPGTAGAPGDPAGQTSLTLDLEYASIDDGEPYRLHGRLTGAGGPAFPFTVDFVGDRSYPVGFTFLAPAYGADPTPLLSGSATGGEREGVEVFGAVFPDEGWTTVPVAFFDAPIAGGGWATDALYDDAGAPAELAPGTYRAEAFQCDSAQNCSEAEGRFGIAAAPAGGGGPVPAVPARSVPSPIGRPLTPRFPAPRVPAAPKPKVRDVVRRLGADAAKAIGRRFAGVRKPFRLIAPVLLPGQPLRVCVFLGGKANAASCFDDAARNVVARGGTTPRRAGTTAFTVRPTRHARRLLGPRRRARVRILVVQQLGFVAPASFGQSVTLRR